MNLATTYLGMHLPHPFVSGASPLADDLDGVKRLEDAGAAAIVMRSLFEEQITREQIATFIHTEAHGESYAEALCYFPSPERFALGSEDYVAHLVRIKQAVACPVIASLNGTTLGGWLSYAQVLEQAGADALELNVYGIPADFELSSAAVERSTIDLLREVKRTIHIPVAVKLSPFYTALPQFARALDDAGADGLVLFNRFYQPDIDPDSLAAVPRLHLSRPSELPLRLRWLAILAGRVRPSLAVSGGVHDGVDAVKAIMSGAHAVQMVSALMRNGPEYLRQVRRETEEWMQAHDYASLEQMRGSMSFESCPDPGVYERANYMLMLQSWNAR